MGFFQRLRQGLTKTRGGLTDKVDELVRNTRQIDEDFYDELTDILILADVGMAATTDIIEKLRQRVKAENIQDAEKGREILKQIIIEEMNIPRPPLKWPMVMFVVGVNGVGKTTTIGKLALRFQEIGHSVMLAAADTFRAAAIEQLEVWAGRADCPMVKHEQGSDPAAVVYDAIQAGKARGTDVIICDTAGRLQNKKNLMDELAKISRIISREAAGCDVEVLLVLDATTGQNALNQARQFREAAGLTGIVLTKLDGTAKGGVIIGIIEELKIPVKFVGVGEKIEDLQPFDPEEFAAGIFGE